MYNKVDGKATLEYTVDIRAGVLRKIGVVIVATKSITKQVYIKDKNNIQKLAGALDNAKNKISQPVVLNRMPNDIKKEDIKNFFGVN